MKLEWEGKSSSSRQSFKYIVNERRPKSPLLILDVTNNFQVSSTRLVRGIKWFDEKTEKLNSLGLPLWINTVDVDVVK